MPCLLALHAFPIPRVGPLSITALSERRRHGEDGGEGLSSSRQTSESLTRRCAVPPPPKPPKAGEGCCLLIFRGRTRCDLRRSHKMNTTRAITSDASVGRVLPRHARPRVVRVHSRGPSGILWRLG